MGEHMEYEDSLESQSEDQLPEEKSRPKLKKRTVIMFGIPVVIASIVAASWFLITASERNYLKELSSLGLSTQFSNEKVSVLQGKAYCGELEAGNDPVGYERQFVAVKYFCPLFLEGFKVIPTPEEQEQDLLTRLRDGGFGGLYASDTEAVSKAKIKCKELENGAALKGPQQEFIAVDIYCNEFVNGFRVLKEIKVKASFYLSGSRYGWYPSIGGSSSNCYGRGGYSDISSSTAWTVTNLAGDILAEGELGPGTGSGSICKFTYTFKVLEGEDKYLVSVGRRGTLRYTESDLKTPDRVKGFLG